LKGVTIYLLGSRYSYPKLEDELLSYYTNKQYEIEPFDFSAIPMITEETRDVEFYRKLYFIG
jgi:hypothetical protein